MKLRRLASLVPFIACFACGGAPPAKPTAVSAKSAEAASGTSDDAAVDDAAKAYLDLLVQLSPETATNLGIHTRDTELDDRSFQGFENAISREEDMLAGLERRFANARLSPEKRTDLAILKGALRVDIRTKQVVVPLERQPDIYTAPLNVLFFMAAREYAPAPERAKNILARMEKIPAHLGIAKTNITHPPKVWTQVAIEKSASAKGFFAEQRPFLIGALPNDQKRIDEAIKTATAAYADFKTFLEKSVLPRSDGKFAVGKEHFEFLLHNDAFLTEDSEGILAIGKRLFDETNRKMDEVAKRIDPKAKGWPEVAKELKGKHPKAADLLSTYRQEVKRARTYCVDKDIVAMPPGDDLEVADTPEFQRSTTTASYEQSPPFDKTTKGFFFVTPVDTKLSLAKQEEMLRESDFGDIVDTSVHEAYPGHHLQQSFSRLNPSVIRKVTGPAIFAEGWALYSEELMAELGYYTDAERLLQLEWTLVRAARVVIDVGLHTKDMTFDEALKMLTDQVHLEHELALSEIKRYTMTPTQPLSYLIGREMIFRMRDRYKAEHAADYSLKKFHTDLLARGTVAPGLLSKEMFEK